MAQDIGVRDRWSDYDPPRADETAEDRAARQHDTDVIRLARAEMETGETNPRLGQRENSGETAEGMQKEVRDRIAAIEAEFSPEDPKLAPFRAQFEALSAPNRRGHTWEELVRAIVRGGQFTSASAFIEAALSIGNSNIECVTEGGARLLISSIAPGEKITVGVPFRNLGVVLSFED